MPDLDEDRAHDRAQFVTGPGRRRRTRGPSVDAYADGPIDRPCPEDLGGCGALPLDFCHHPDGAIRKLPCLQRLSEAFHEQ